MCIGLGNEGRRVGVGALAGAVVSVAAGLASPAGGQSLQFEPPLYRGSAEGVPLEGQDGWYVPGGGASAWRVYHNGGSELGFAPLPAGDGNVAGVALDAPLGLPEVTEHSADIRSPIVIMLMHIAVDFDPALPAGEEIGRMTLEPERESASFGWVARGDDGGAETWTFDLIYYTASGERRQAAFVEGLQPGEWHELAFSVGFTDIEIVKITSLRSWRISRLDTQGLHVGGGIGGLPLSRAIRFKAGAGEAPGLTYLAFAVDNIWIGPRHPCYQDCDRSGPWDFFDFLCFQNRFVGGDPWADCDGTGSLDFFDFLCFLNHFAGGCEP